MTSTPSSESLTASRPNVTLTIDTKKVKHFLGRGYGSLDRFLAINAPEN